jgi:hypothetical protein
MPDPTPALDEAQKPEKAAESYVPTNIEKIFESLDQRLVTLGIPGMLAAVGATKAKEGKWTEVGLCFAGAVGVWILIRVGKKLAPKLDELLEWSINGIAKWIQEGWSSLRSDFEGTFLKRQARLSEEYISEGFNPDRTAVLSLEDVFVPLDLSGALSSGMIDGSDVPASLMTDSLDIWKLLARSRRDRKFRQIAILAKGGMGKTTLLQHIVLIYGQRNQRRYRAPKLVPVMLRLRDFTDLLAGEIPPSLPSLIANFYIPKLSKNHPLSAPPQWAEKLLQGNSALIMFDGFDEILEEKRHRVSHWISGQMREYENAVFILTSRPAGYEDYSAQKLSLPIYVKKFSLKQQEEFIRSWYLWQERYARSEKNRRRAKEVAQERSQHLIDQLNAQREELGYMAENPLLLHMLVTFHRFSPSKRLPQQRIGLYEGICKLQLEDRPQARLIQMSLTANQSRLILQELALELTKQKQIKIGQNNLLKLFNTSPVLQTKGVVAHDFLTEIVDVSELLVEREPGEYEFPHLSFQGFFAAAQLVGVDGVTTGEDIEANKQLVLQNWNDAVWRETVLLYAAQLPPPRLEELIRSASEISSESGELAVLCLKEYPRPEKFSSELDALFKTLRTVAKTSKYYHLEELLQSKQWRDADKETYRLMITTVGKETGQWFDAEDLSNFSCEDLRVLDGLWVRYSEGKWGFSVQKRIWQECGSPGPYDGKTKSRWEWEQFTERVGWRKDGNWLEYKNFSWSERGELPCGWGAGWLGGGGGYLVGFSLFSRPDL